MIEISRQEMDKVLLSESGPEVSAAIYSFWRWDNYAYYSIKKMEQVIGLNLSLGVNTFDHSNRIASGKIESLFGQALQAGLFKRDDIVISTKAGTRYSETYQNNYADLSSDYITRSVEESLKRLKTDYIDIFLLEDYDPLLNAEEIASAITQLILKGKIRFIGVSNFTVFQHQLLANYLGVPIVTNHIELNVLNSVAIDDGRLDFIRQHFSKPLARAPLAGGRVLDGQDNKAVVMRNVLKEVGEKYDANIEQTAVAWLHKLGALPIIGSLEEERISNAASAHRIKLSHEDWHRIYQHTK
jgi:predicted oxidoreductase